MEFLIIILFVFVWLFGPAMKQAARDVQNIRNRKRKGRRTPENNENFVPNYKERHWKREGDNTLYRNDRVMSATDYISITNMSTDEQDIRQIALEQIYTEHKQTNSYPDIYLSLQHKSTHEGNTLTGVDVLDKHGKKLGYLRTHSLLFGVVATNKRTKQHIVDVSPNKERGYGYRCRISIKSA